jgi:hypothetical protein
LSQFIGTISAFLKEFPAMDGFQTTPAQLQKSDVDYAHRKVDAGLGPHWRDFSNN